MHWLYMCQTIKWSNIIGEKVNELKVIKAPKFGSSSRGNKFKSPFKTPENYYE